MSLIKCVLFAVLLAFVRGYNVLLFFPFPSGSHAILGEGYVRHLVKAGHNVTYVTPMPMKSSASNLRQINMSSTVVKGLIDNVFDITKLLENEIDLLDKEITFQEQHVIAAVVLQDEKVQELLLDTSEKFDVAVVEWLYSELYAGIPAVFNCPYIWSSSMEPHPMVLRLVDEVPNPAYTPDHMSTHTPPLTFRQRAEELWNLLSYLHIRWKRADVETKTFREAFGPAFFKRGLQIPSFEEIKFNASLMLGNSHVSSGLAIRLPQNYKPIAGYHIEKKTPALPEVPMMNGKKNFKKIMDNAQHGVIYFSLGTVMKGKTMPAEMKAGFLKTFGELKQVVIWKLEEQLPNAPKNVHIVEWAPQPSILAHPNTVLFITHGGLLSTTETLHYGVPVIGIPLFADQFLNIKRAVTRGLGIYIPLSYNTPIELKGAIDEMLRDPKYRERAKELSLVYHDRPVSPGEELVHWVEHVVKTRGAPHLRSVALLVSWYQKLYLDLLVVFFITIITLMLLCSKLLFKVVKNENTKQKIN